MKKIWKRTLAMLLVVIMVGGAAPIGALAEMDWPVLQDNETVSWWNNGMNAVKTAASWLGDKFHGLSLRASAASVVTITSPSTDQSNIAWLDVDDLGQVTWTCSSSLVASYRYTIIEINTSGETVLDIARNQWIGRNVMNLYAYKDQFNPSRRYKIWVGAYKDSEGNEIIDSGASLFIYTKGTAPEVTTSSATNITESSATLNGKLVKNNALPIEACGFVYSTSSTTSALRVNSSTGTTITIPGATGSISNYSMSKAISGLEPDTTYYYRAYATNAAGISYGTTKSFTTDIDPQTMPAITSVTASPISAGQGTTFTFTVKANEYTEKVGLEIDGNSIAESTSYSVKNGTHTFSISYRIMSIGDDRQVVAYPYKGSQKLTSGTASTTVSVTESDDIGTPQVTSPASGIAQTSNTALTVTWDATPIAPDSYTVIIYRAGSGSIYRKTDVTSRTCTVPAEVFSVAGNYSVEVYAIKEGYASDHPGGVEFIVEAETTDPRIISVEVDPPEGLPNTEYTFTVTANKYTSKIGVEVAGNAIGTTTSYTTVGTTRVFTIKKVISSSGTRAVIAYPYKSSQKLEVGTANTTLLILDAPSAGVPTLITPQTGHTYNYYYGLPVRWTAPSTAPDSYKILLYLNGAVTYEATTEETSYSIPSSKLKANKSYSVEVYAVKAGYKQDAPATAEFKTVSILITPPTVSSASADKTSIAANEEITFTVVTSKTATELYMLAEDGEIAEKWTDSSLYNTVSSKRTWTVTRTIHSEGERTLRFCAGVDGFINTESYKDVSITVTANEDMKAVVLMTSSDATLTQGDSYTATWTCNVTPSSYTVIVYCNGNQIYTQKNYTSNSFTVRPALLSEPGNYSVEVYPILARYKSIWGAVELTVQPQVQSDVQILNVSVPDSVRANTDTFICNVTTNAAAAQVFMIYETGGKLDLTYQYTRSGNKVWQLTKKLDTIGLRKMRVVACDGAGNESQPYSFTVSVLPNEIPWDMQYDPETGDLTISATAEQVGDSLNAAYAKIVVYEQGYKKDLVPEFNAQTIINSTGTYSKTWNVFTDLGLTSGQTYEIAVGYISTLVNYYGGHDRLVIARNSYKITPEYVDVPVVYSVEFSDVNEGKAANRVKSNTRGDNDEIKLRLGESKKVTVVTSSNVNRVRWRPENAPDVSSNYSVIGKLVSKTTDEGRKKTTWVFEKTFTALHAERPFIVIGEEMDGDTIISSEYYETKIVSVYFPTECNWEGIFDGGLLTVRETNPGAYPVIKMDDGSKVKTINSNCYYLWIKRVNDDGSRTMIHHFGDNNNKNKILLVKRQNLADAPRQTYSISELSALGGFEEGRTYEFGIGGKSKDFPSNRVQTTDIVTPVGTFEYHGGQSGTVEREIANETTLYYTANKNDYVRRIDSIPIPIPIPLRLPAGTKVTINSVYENYGNKQWVQVIKYEDDAGNVQEEGGPWYLQASDLRVIQQDFVWPLKKGTGNNNIYHINCPFGIRRHPNRGTKGLHGAIDIGGSGNIIVAVADGKVVQSDKDGGYGHYIIIEHSINGQSYYSFYSHMKSRCVKKDDSVSAEQKLGEVGDTGDYCGEGNYHLHFGLYKSNEDIFGYQDSVNPIPEVGYWYDKETEGRSYTTGLYTGVTTSGGDNYDIVGNETVGYAFNSHSMFVFEPGHYENGKLVPGKYVSNPNFDPFNDKSQSMSNYYSYEEPKPDATDPKTLESDFKKAKIALYDSDPISVSIDLFNKYEELIDTIVLSEDQLANGISVPASTCTALLSYNAPNIADEVIISMNGKVITDLETEIEDGSIINIEHIYEDGTKETYACMVSKQQPTSESTANEISVKCFSGDYLMDVQPQMGLTLPRSISEIDLHIDCDPLAHLQVYRNDIPLILTDSILIDELETSDFRIVITAEDGSETEYELVVRKKQEQESDANLDAIILADRPCEDYYDYISTDQNSTNIALQDRDLALSVYAVASSPFAACDLYIDNEPYDGTAVVLEDNSVIKAIVTAEDGTTQEYTFPVHYKKYYTVTWNVNGNQTLESCLEGNDLTAMLDPTKTGYTFTGWSSPVPETMPAANLEFTALFTANTYTLTFNASGGVCATGTKTVTFDAAYGTLPVPQRSGFVFDGWHAEGNATVLNEQSLVQTASDQTLYADWSMLGDVLRDEDINLQDVVLLTRHLAGGWDTTGIHVPAGDVNRDGEVNLKDAVLIRRYLAGGWNVELK